MRTRFLTEFFNSSAASQSLQTLEFLRFPPPQLPSPDICNFDNLYCFDQVASLNISPQVEWFSVNNSLSKFFSDVLPQHINAEIDQQIASAVTSEEIIDGYIDGAFKTFFSLLEFETPELQSSLKDSSVLHEEKMQLVFEVADSEVNLDLLDFSHEVQKLHDVQKSIFHVEDYHLEFQEDHRCSDVIANGGLIQGQKSSKLRTFPLLEIDETSLGINSCTSEDKHIIFESNEPQQWIQKSELAFDDHDQFLSMKFNILEHLLDNPPVPCHQFELPSVNFDPDHIINAIDSLTLSPLVLEPPKFFDTNTPHFSQVFFNTESINGTEHCEQMFGETTFATFNDLIVKHELILKDDSFKSLPVPIFSDHEKILSAHEIVEEMFQQLRVQPSSTSDDIYLDWHLLEEEISSHNLKIFEDIDTYDVDADMKSSDSEMIILEFVLFDGNSNEGICTENREVLRIKISGSLMDSVADDGIGSSKKMEIREASVENTVKKDDHQLVEPMLEFDDDLEFFLNSLEGTLVNKQKDADKKLEMDYPLPPVASAKIPMESHDTSKKQQHTGGDFHSTSILKESSKNSEGQSHSKPVEEKNSIGSLEANVNTKMPELPSVMQPNKINTNTCSLADSIIIVNTQNGTEMVISRRSTYRRILEMEKKGVQVVERDLNPNLPVDLILSPCLCLVLYHSKNITTKTNTNTNTNTNTCSSVTEYSSCVENIAANVLTSLSFSFTACILIFEGDISFVGGIMESSDELYVAAAGLGVDLQIFFSESCDSSDDIILNCISHAANSTKGLFPKMPESETLAESFLSKFPSLNPLSAQTILSSVQSLLEFFEMPHQQRVSLMKRYLVPEVSMELFSSLCRYGEREDSRSGTTDCCSSVSSGHDSRPSKVDHHSDKTNHIPMPMPMPMSMTMDDDVTWDIPKMNMEFDMVSFGEKQTSDPSLTSVFGSQTTYNSKGVQEGYRGQVIDIDDDDVAGVDFSFGHTVSLPVETRNLPDNYGNGKYDWCSFPRENEITETEISNNVVRGMSSEDSWTVEDSPFKFQRLDMKGKQGVSNNGGERETPLSKAISTGTPEKGSPWTVDFINRMKEKSRMRHHSLPLISSAPCFVNSSTNSRKRKSPSLLDLYRFKKNNSSTQINHKKGQNSHFQLQPSNASKAVQPSPSLSLSWTPMDMRAKRKLTFAADGSKGQSKLIWTHPNLNRRL